MTALKRLNVSLERSIDFQEKPCRWLILREKKYIFKICDRLAERSGKGLDRGKSAVKYRVFIGFFADSISDQESFRAFRLNVYFKTNG
jgi:hypothetical protein